jgi:hypothetical protein
MQIEYLNNKSWKEISREERLFCAELYHAICHDQKPFLELLGIDSNKSFDVGYEVCFYRDVLSAHNIKIGETKLPHKRTFDLALFSNQEIYIVEAKAHQRFETKQLKYFEKDKEYIEKLFSIIGKSIPKISVNAIVSSGYNPKDSTLRYFDKKITWKQLSAKYLSSKELFERADAIYQK